MGWVVVPHGPFWGGRAGPPGGFLRWWRVIRRRGILGWWQRTWRLWPRWIRIGRQFQSIQHGLVHPHVTALGSGANAYAQFVQSQSRIGKADDLKGR